MDRLNEYQDERWKERARKIRALDGHKCAICGAKGTLHVHHLSYPPAPFHLWDSRDDELVTLCPECHRKVHESSYRISLDILRNVIGFVDDGGQDKAAEESWEFEMECEREYNNAKQSGVECCANCALSNYYRPLLYCKKRIEEDRDITYTPPTEHCDSFECKNCNNCKHFSPDDPYTGEGFCTEILSKGDPTRVWDIKSCELCNGENWKHK